MCSSDLVVFGGLFNSVVEELCQQWWAAVVLGQWLEGCSGGGDATLKFD